MCVCARAGDTPLGVRAQCGIPPRPGPWSRGVVPRRGQWQAGGCRDPGGCVGSRRPRLGGPTSGGEAESGRGPGTRWRLGEAGGRSGSRRRAPRMVRRIWPEVHGGATALGLLDLAVELGRTQRPPRWPPASATPLQQEFGEPRSAVGPRRGPRSRREAGPSPCGTTDSETGCRSFPAWPGTDRPRGGGPDLSGTPRPGARRDLWAGLGAPSGSPQVGCFLPGGKLG